MQSPQSSQLEHLCACRADKYSCQQLELAARHFIRQNFEQVVQWDIEHAEHNSIAHLNQSTLMQILTDNELAVKSEMNVFQALKQWILAQPVQTSGLLYEMMQVRSIGTR